MTRQNNPRPPEEDGFYTPKTMWTVVGETAAVSIVCSAIGRAFDFRPPYLALIVSLIIAYFGISQVPRRQRKPAIYLIAFVNGCLLYLQALGVISSLSSHPSEPPSARYREAAAAILPPGVVHWLGLDIPWVLPGRLEAAAQVTVTSARAMDEVSSTVAQQLEDLPAAIASDRNQLNRELGKVRSNIAATERGLANHPSPAEYLPEHLIQLQKEEARLLAKLKSLDSLDAALQGPDSETKKIFYEMGASLNSPTDELKQATANLAAACAQRRVVPWGPK